MSDPDREAFEAEAVKPSLIIQIEPNDFAQTDGQYNDVIVNKLYVIWTAALAHARTEQAERTTKSQDTTVTDKVASIMAKSVLEPGINDVMALARACANPDPRTEQAAKDAEIARLREALEEIAHQHIGDCPMTLAHLSDEDWARRCHGNLRRVARAVLAPTATPPWAEPSP